MKKIGSIIFKYLVALIAIVGLLHGTGIIKGKFYGDSLVYYTNLSNLVVAIFMLTQATLEVLELTKKGFKTPKIFVRFKGAIVIMILVTGLIYDFLLADYSDLAGTFSISSTCLHFLVPYLTLADWLIFDEKGKFKKFDPLLWLITPCLYLPFIYIRSIFVQGTGSVIYPYFFLDPTKIGVGGVISYIIVLILCFVILGYLFYFLDSKVLKNKK